MQFEYERWAVVVLELVLTALRLFKVIGAIHLRDPYRKNRAYSNTILQYLLSVLPIMYSSERKILELFSLISINNSN